ncbi:MAG: hypothetical protein RBR01_02900 [Desulfobacterales bacterium]|jgi:hypothetical protein|nr:hypothetical protein [Desulfobacterales bacterium]MDD3081428.1 hypothetical protein [Desulfobacterales bacterium]MDD3950744.1 hypothetical protein [Desulfobacterales bacterium]MDD4464369.1 hypothetical protein [Desulfobacterales bacterium]MDY0377361.1 hypothetical protein [Desulfobacterales bacterium]
MNPWFALVLGLALMAVGVLSPFSSFGALFLVAGAVVLINAAHSLFRRK